MAKRIETVVHLIDDLDGGKATATIPFALDGTSYEIDLSARNARAFRKALEPYVAVARTTRPRRGKSGKRKGAAVDLAAVRAWAHEQGLEVNGRGRIPAAVVDAYRAAN